MKWWPRCLTLNVAEALQSQITCEVVSDVCVYLSHLGFCTSLSLNKCPFQLQCPLSNLVIFLSWFLLRLSTSPDFSQMVFEKSLSLPFSTYGPLMLFMSPYPVHNYHLPAPFHFHQFPCVPTPKSVEPCHVLPVSPGTDDSPSLVGVYLKVIKHLNGHVTSRENIDVPTFVALFYILH